MGLCYFLIDVFVVGVKVVGVKFMNLKDGDRIVNGLFVLVDGDMLIVIVI